jgi:hypothetical protein
MSQRIALLHTSSPNPIAEAARKEEMIPALCGISAENRLGVSHVTPS